MLMIHAAIRHVYALSRGSQGFRVYVITEAFKLACIQQNESSCVVQLVSHDRYVPRDDRKSNNQYTEEMQSR